MKLLALDTSSVACSAALRLDETIIERHEERALTLATIPADDPAFANHRQLAEKSRQKILAVLDEPDLCAK